MRRSLLPKLLLAGCLFGLLGGLFAVQAVTDVRGAGLGSGVPAECSFDPVSTIGGRVQSIAVSGSYLYVGDVAALVILDATAMPQPRILSRLPLPDGVSDINVVGTRAYLAVGSAGLYIVDVADPAAPQVVGVLDLADTVGGLRVDGGKAYLVTSNSAAFSLQIVDIQQPAAPVVLGTYSVNRTNNFSVLGNLRVVGTIAYLFSRTDSDSVQLVSVADPANPTLLSVIPGNEVHAFDVSGTTVYVTQGTTLNIYSTSDPANPTLIKSQEFLGTLYSVYLAGDRAYLSGSTSLSIVDITQPSAPLLLSSTTLAHNQPGRLFVVGTTVYMLSGSGGLQILDASNAAQPQLLDRGYFMSGLGYADVVGTVAYLANGPPATARSRLDRVGRLYGSGNG